MISLSVPPPVKFGSSIKVGAGGAEPGDKTQKESLPDQSDNAEWLGSLALTFQYHL